MHGHKRDIKGTKREFYVPCVFDEGNNEVSNTIRDQNKNLIFPKHPKKTSAHGKYELKHFAFRI